MKNTTLIIDFDSTFIQTESLEELFSLSLKNDPEKESKVAEISRITTLGMEGQINFRDSLLQRIKLLKAGKSEVEKVGQLIKNQVSPSVLANKHFFKLNAKKIYIISGGFKEIIWEVVKNFGILKSHILANEFIYDKDHQIVGVDLENLCSQSHGKGQ
jgi:D-3-phosphoglycerate dehydrogenase